MPMKFGIDISKYQKGLNIERAIKNHGVEFVIIKAGGADSVLYKDSCFEDFYNQATNAKIPKGAYFFGYAIDEAGAIKEADYFLTLVKGKSFEMPFFYDCEAKRQRSLSNAKLQAVINAFVNRVQANGYRCGVYGSAISGFKDHFPSLTCMKWVASYTRNKPSNNAINDKFVIWQFGGETNLIRSNKIDGKVCDQDYLYDESIIITSGSVAKVEEKTEIKTEKTTVNTKTGNDLPTNRESKYQNGKSFTVKATLGLNVRSGAGTNKKRITTLKNKTTVMWYGLYSTDSKGYKWYLVAYPGGEGYVRSDYLK